MEPEVGSLVFTGAGAGIVFGYVDGEDADGNPTREAIVGRFASSERVPVNELGSTPAQQNPDDPALGAVAAEPSHEGSALDTSDPEADVPFSPSTAEAPAYAGGETNAEREARQDRELAELRASEQGAPAPATTTPPIPPSEQPVEQTSVATQPGETTPPVGGTQESPGTSAASPSETAQPRTGQA